MSNVIYEELILETVNIETHSLEEVFEDLRNLQDLRVAVERNQNKPGIPWEQAKEGIFE